VGTSGGARAAEQVRALPAVAGGVGAAMRPCQPAHPFAHPLVRGRVTQDGWRHLAVEQPFCNYPRKPRTNYA
jgi:hypothetical protein